MYGIISSNDLQPGGAAADEGAENDREADEDSEISGDEVLHSDATAARPSTSAAYARGLYIEDFQFLKVIGQGNFGRVSRVLIRFIFCHVRLFHSLV